jgi:pimeloyl-ACP methyl ester carboxylesterase
MNPSESVHVPVRGIDHHCRVWGAADDPLLIFLHGWQDNSASWQFTVDALSRRFRVVAPDWRGYGRSSWSGSDTYWMPDLVADLEFLLDHFEPEDPVDVVAHSMGGTIASLHAAVVPGRIRRLVNVEGLGGRPDRPEELPRRYSRWLRQLREGVEQRPYADYTEFAERMIAENPRLTAERAMFLAREWGVEDPDGGIVRRADPAQAGIRPTIYRSDETIACWRKIKAEVLWVEGAESDHVEAMRGVDGGYEDRLAAIENLAGVERIAGAGHNVHHDQPEKLAALVDDFMRPRGYA